MGFFNRKKELTKTEPKIITKSTTASAITEPSLSISMFPGFGASTASGVTVTPQTVLELSAAYACIHFITTDIAKLPLDLQQRQNKTGWKTNTDHPLNKKIKVPNKRDTIVTLLQTVIFNFLMDGNGYVVIIRNPDGSPNKLIPANYWQTSVSEKENGDRQYIVTSKLLVDETTSITTEQGPTRIIREEDMIHIQNFSLWNNTRGLSPVQMANEVFGLGLAAQESAARAFQNGSFFQGFLKVNGTANPQKTAQIGENWARAQQSVTNSGRTPVIPGDVDYVNIGASPSELQLLESREQITKEIARMFKVPSHKLGFNESDKAANMEQQERSYISDALEPITRQLEEQMDRKLLFEDELTQIRFHFDFSKMIQADQLQRYQSYAIGITNGFMNQDEVREQEGYAPLPNNEGQVFHTPTYTALQDGTGSINIGRSDEQ